MGSSSDGAEYTRVWAVLVTVLSYPLGLLLGSPWLLPVLNAAPGYVAMVVLLRRGERAAAIRMVLVWALTLAVCGTLSFRFWPNLRGATVLHGPEYQQEMFLWIKTGTGSEGDLRLFLPQHLRHLGAFVLLCLVTASAGSILMGAVLMNYMAFYVASLSRAGVPAWAVLLLGWQPYALCRIAAFCVLGAVLAEPLLCRVLHYPYRGLKSSRRWILMAAGGLLLDIGLKAWIAPFWGRWLLRMLF
jgi:hypothetical protein